MNEWISSLTFFHYLFAVLMIIDIAAPPYIAKSGEEVDAKYLKWQLEYGLIPFFIFKLILITIVFKNPSRPFGRTGIEFPVLFYVFFVFDYLLRFLRNLKEKNNLIK